MTPDAAASPHSLATASGLLLGTLAAGHDRRRARRLGARIRGDRPSRRRARSGFRSASRSSTRCTAGRRRRELRDVHDAAAASGAGSRRRSPAAPSSSSRSPCSPSPAGRSTGWALAAVLWAAAEAFALVLARLPGNADNLAAAGMRGIGTTSRALLVGIPLVIVTVSNETVGLGGSASVRARVHGRARRRARDLLRAAGRAREAPLRTRVRPVRRAALGRARFLRRARRTRTRARSSPQEWELHDWIPIHIGPIDMSINKAVAYLLLGALCSCVLGIVLMRVKVGKDPTRRQALARRSTRSRRFRSPSRASRRRRSGAGSRTSRR